MAWLGECWTLGYSTRLEEEFSSSCFPSAVILKCQNKNKTHKESSLQMFEVLPKDYFHMLYTLLILIALKFIMYNKCKCSSCQGSSVSQFLETNYQDLYLDTVTHWLYYHCGQISSLLNLLNHIMLMTMVMINNLPHWVLLVLNVKTCTTEYSFACTEKAQ